MQDYYDRSVDEDFFYCDEVDSDVLVDFYRRNSGMLQYLDRRMVDCGNELVEFYDSGRNEFIELPVYCDNRSCLNVACQDHRGMLYKKNHRGQIAKLKSSIVKPKAWVFTTDRVDMPVDKSRLRFHMKRLVALLRKYSVTEFSVHMEIKFDRKDKCYDGKYYLHFHVVTGGVRDYRLVRKLWQFNVFYEKAIRYNNVAKYISKYASKVPNLPNEFCHHVYMVSCYKLQMHKFSCGRGDDLKVVPSFFMVDMLVREMNNVSKYNVDKYFDCIRDRPPDEVMDKRVRDLGMDPADVPSCVYVHAKKGRI